MQNIAFFLRRLRLFAAMASADFPWSGRLLTHG
jgi:hypothetical protein